MGVAPTQMTGPQWPADRPATGARRRADAAFRLGIGRRAAAHRRSRARRHPPTSGSHAEQQEHARIAWMPRLRGEDRSSEACEKAICDGGREPEGAAWAVGARTSLRTPSLDHRRRGCQKFRERATKISSSSHKSGCAESWRRRLQIETRAQSVANRRSYILQLGTGSAHTLMMRCRTSPTACR